MEESRGSFPFRFRCRRSGNCCAVPEGVVRVTPADIREIARHLHMKETAVRARFVAARGDRLIEGPGGRCPFLEEGRETRCKIYAVRPQKCRDWPYWEELIGDPAAIRAAARLCPGIELSGLPLHPGANPADNSRMLRVISILLSALWLSGCFVNDELRQGDALIEQHSSGWREKKQQMQQAEAEAAKAEAEAQSKKAQDTGPGVQDKLSEWWQETVAEEPVNANPDDKLVSCTIGGTVKFVRESDCKVRRGRAKQLKARNDATVTAPSKSKPGA